MADDIEGQLPRLRAQQLRLQERGPLLLQQLVSAHVVLGPRGRSQRRPAPSARPDAPPPRPRPAPIGPWALGHASATSPLAARRPASAGAADLADSGHAGGVELLEELELAGCLLEEEVDELGRGDGCHEGGVRCGTGQRGLVLGRPTPPRPGAGPQTGCPAAGGGPGGHPAPLRFPGASRAGSCPRLQCSHGAGALQGGRGGVTAVLGLGLGSPLLAREGPDLCWGLGSLRCSQRRKLSVLRTGWGPSVRIRMGSLPRKLFMVPE